MRPACRWKKAKEHSAMLLDYKLIGFAFLGFLLSAPAGRADISVSSATELAGALSQAVDGEAILLAAGDYGRLDLNGSTRNDLAVTLRSADPLAPARFSGLTIRQTANVTLDGITFDYSFQAGDQVWTAPFEITQSRNVVIRNSRFDGDLAQGVSETDDGFGTGIGLSVDQATDLTLDKNVFFDFYRGLVVSDSDRTAVTGNDIYAIRSDGMNFVADQTLLVAENQLHDFKASQASDDHADMIQFWTAGTTRPTRDVTIRDNVLNSGNGNWTQSIFMGNELVSQGKAGPEMRYQNIAIIDNVIINSQLHGISVGDVDGLLIANNTLIQNPKTEGAKDNPTLWTPRINITPSAQNVTVLGNATPGISGPEDRPDWTVEGNILIQDTKPSAPFYYDKIFVAALSGDPQSIASFLYVPGGPVDGVKVGAARLISLAPSAEVTAQIRAARATLSVKRAAIVPGSGTGSDRSKEVDKLAAPGAEEPAVSHTAAHSNAGHGAKASDAAALLPPSPNLLHFDPTTGQLLVNQGNGMLALSDIDVVNPAGETGWALPIGMGRNAIEIPHTQLHDMFDTRDFDLKLRLQVAATANPGGDILRIHNSMALEWQPDKGFGFSLQTVGGPAILIWTRTLRLDPGVWYDIRIHYGAATGIAAVEIDGKLRIRGRTTGPLKPDQAQGLYLGNSVGEKSFDGFLGGLDLQTGVAALASTAP